MYIAANPDGQIKIFKEKPHRITEPIMVEDKDQTFEDHYGKEYHPFKESGDFRKIWYTDYYGLNHGYGFTINREIFNEEIQKLTWNDEPIEIGPSWLSQENNEKFEQQEIHAPLR